MAFYCDNCGVSVREIAKYCRQCGHRLDRVAPQSQEGHGDAKGSANQHFPQSGRGPERSANPALSDGRDPSRESTSGRRSLLPEMLGLPPDDPDLNIFGIPRDLFGPAKRRH